MATLQGAGSWNTFDDIRRQRVRCCLANSNPLFVFCLRRTHVRAHLVMQLLVVTLLVPTCPADERTAHRVADKQDKHTGTEASDHAIVQALLRIPNATLDAYPHRAEAVQRHVARLLDVSPDEFVDVVEQLEVPSQSEALQTIMLDPQSGQAGIDATGLLVRSGRIDIVKRDTVTSSSSSK